MKVATAHLRSISPYSQSRAHETPELPRETKNAYEVRTWREKSHFTDDGHIFIPPMAFKQALDRSAQMLSRQIPGKGKATYTKFFLSGVMCIDPVVLPITKDEVLPERIYANADGKRGSGKRVYRTFPVIQKWESDVPFTVLADEITESVFEEHLRQAGNFVGIGRFRPGNGGFFGRFAVDSVTWKEI